jgi:hypothetical protein
MLSYAMPLPFFCMRRCFRATLAYAALSCAVMSSSVSAVPYVTTISRQPQTTLAVVGTSTVFRVTFNASVTGVDTSDFILVKIGTVNGTIASVSGSGTTYDVTVNSITGFGQLRLDLKGSGTGIVDGGSVAITEGFYNGQTITFGTYVPVGWGINSVGQMGDGTNVSPRSIPVAATVSGVLSGKNIVSLASGGGHTVALTADNLLYTWGQGSSGQLGDGQPITGYSSSIPVAVTMSGVLSGKTIVAIACGSTHSMALDSTGKLYAWGQNAAGQLGDGLGASGVTSNVPVAVSTSGVLSGKVITGVAGGSSFNIVCTSDGGVYAWGQGTNGQIGNGLNDTRTVLPVAVTTSGVLSGKRVVAVAAGTSFAAALTSDGRVYTWGSNNQGQIGDGGTINVPTNFNVPVAVSGTGLPGVKTIANIFCSTQAVFAFATDGTLYVWGSNLLGTLGIGSNTSSSTPVAFPMTGVLSGKTINTLSTGNGYAYALTTEGKVYSWGTNTFSQLGDGTTTERTSPVAVDVSASSALNGKTVGFLTIGSHASFGMVGINAAVPDTTPPTVVSIVRQTPTAQATSSTSATFRVTFSEAVNAPAASNFAITPVSSSSITGSIGTVSAVNDSTYDVPVTITGGTGEFRLKIID